MSETEIGAKEAEGLGIWTKHSKMENGELRFRLRSRDGSAYIRTEATSESGWQRSHKHRSVQETYIVQHGRMVLAECIDDRLRIRVITAGGIVTTQPHVPHNVYMFPRAIIHTVKHGEEGETNDWIAEPSLDAKTRDLTEADILELAK
jgi:mannose-6-phosphate isomerase-like protein (cupin superfamily)